MYSKILYKSLSSENIGWTCGAATEQMHHNSAMDPLTRAGNIRKLVGK